MFALVKQGVKGAAAPFTAYDVILRARPQTCGAQRMTSFFLAGAAAPAPCFASANIAF